MDSNDENRDSFTQRSIDPYNLAALKGNTKEIEQCKYNLLAEAHNLFEVVINYIALEQCGIRFDFGTSRITKGSCLYRIRRYDAEIDFDDESAWKPNPARTQGRANRKGQEALYLGSAEDICLMETHTDCGQRYALGTYECDKNINVGGFLNADIENNLKTLTGMTLNAFLIAPSRGESNSSLFELLDRHYGRLMPDDFSSFSLATGKSGMELPYKFGVLNQRDCFYEMTNQLCDIIASRHPEGIRYSSCYFPMEAPGIACSAFNLALYPSGVDKLKFLGYEIKTNEKPKTSVDVAKCLIGSDR